MTDEEESGLPGAEDALGFGSEESEPTVGEEGKELGEEGKGLGVDEPDALVVDMGAALDADEDAMKEAAETSLGMEGFETGGGFDLDDLPDSGGQYVEIEPMEVRSSSFDEFDAEEAEASSSAEPSREHLVVEGDVGGSGDIDRTISTAADLTIPDQDEASLLLPTPAADEAAPRARHRGLEALERRRKRRTRVLWMMTVSTVLIVGGAGFAVAYWGLIEIPGITPSGRSRSAAPAPVALPGPQPETPVMSHVIFIDTWREAETPRAWADALRERMPDLLGLVTPLSIDGDRQYALLVGPAYNAGEADELRGPLAVAFELLNPNPDSWAIQEAPYSFFFGEYETLEEANGRVQALADLSIPAFVLQVTYPAQTGALRVYGGAFSDEFQAGGMARLLSENDLSDVPFTERRGRLPD